MTQTSERTSEPLPRSGSRRAALWSRFAALREGVAPYALLPLRLFLGVTFVYAGLDKLFDPAFLSDDPERQGSIAFQMTNIRDLSAIPSLVDLGLKAPVAVGAAMAVGELLVGLGTLAGLFARVAALGGALISLSLWLTMSWQASPYYYGNDLPYLMAWLPLVLAGAAYWSLDALIRSRRSRRTA